MKSTLLILCCTISIALLFTSFKGHGGDETVKIGGQEWMVNNLDVGYFRNGDTIPQAKTAKECFEAGQAGKAAWCYYNNEAGNNKKYGKLYNWYAVNDPRGLAPKGWHVPSDKEWKKIIAYLGGEEVAGSKMKSTSGWEKDGNGTNSSGFAALPGGRVACTGGFSNFNHEGNWWGSTEEKPYIAGDKSHGAFSFVLYSSFAGAEINKGDCKEAAYSVRCIKD
jgi:uncharacterized protein (TIGR02145 family)